MRSTAAVGEQLSRLLGADRVEHRPNHAGADKLSFAVRRGGEPLWARVAADAAEDRALRRWASHGDRLAQRYAAPPVLDVLTVAGRTTLLFPLVTAPVATREAVRPRCGPLLALLGRLHGDAELAGALGPPVTARDAFTEVWVHRLTTDLAVVEGYVAVDEHAWLRDEVDALADLVAGEAFEAVVRSPTHGDPWHENLLVTPERFWLLDWEDLAVGDPVVDDAILLADALGPDARAWRALRPPADEAEAARFEVACRALLLDAVIDVAADWVQARDPLVRQAKAAAWRSALEAYRATYG